MSHGFYTVLHGFQRKWMNSHGLTRAFTARMDLRSGGEKECPSRQYHWNTPEIVYGL